MSLLEVKNLSIEFETDAGPLQASDQVSFSVEEGEILGVVGESGCGKSVSNMGLLKLIPQPPGKIKSGEAIFKGKDLLQMSSSELREVRGAEIGVIFQEPMTALSPLQKIGKQLAEALSYHKKLVKKDAKEEVKKWLHKVGIGDVDKRVKNYPFQFSGGMRQRVMIAGTLMLEPDLIIADEPTTALDVTIQAQIFDILKKMKADKTAVILITHDMGVVWEMCDRVIVMYASQVVEEGPVKEIFGCFEIFTRGAVLIFSSPYSVSSHLYFLLDIPCPRS